MEGISKQVFIQSEFPTLQYLRTISILNNIVKILRANLLSDISISFSSDTLQSYFYQCTLREMIFVMIERRVASKARIIYQLLVLFVQPLLANERILNLKVGAVKFLLFYLNRRYHELSFSIVNIYLWRTLQYLRQNSRWSYHSLLKLSVYWGKIFNLKYLLVIP